jgi:hypothetical protein
MFELFKKSFVMSIYKVQNFPLNKETKSK